MGGLVVLVSGGGTTLQNLIDAEAAGSVAETLRLVIADRPCGALDRAAAANIPRLLLDRKLYRAQLSQAILDAIPRDARLVVLGGFLSILREPLLTSFRRRIINIHPSLLPRHGGAGMYGRRVHESVLAAGEKESGCTVHFVDEGTDTGEIILQRRCEVLPGDTPDTLATRVAALEREAILSGVSAALSLEVAR